MLNLQHGVVKSPKTVFRNVHFQHSTFPNRGGGGSTYIELKPITCKFNLQKSSLKTFIIKFI